LAQQLQVDRLRAQMHRACCEQAVGPQLVYYKTFELRTNVALDMFAHCLNTGETLMVTDATLVSKYLNETV
jgi:hypothetical protein